MSVRKNNISYKVIRRNVKYARLEIKAGNLVVVAPHSPRFDVEDFVAQHLPWIEKKLNYIKEVKFKFKDMKLEERPIEELKSKVAENIENIKKELGVEPSKVRFTEMRSRWGSCSSAGNLNFNKLLRFMPDEMVEYIVYHEMCHLLHMNHSADFWNQVKDKYPNHKEYEEKLFGYWFLVSEKLAR